MAEIEDIAIISKMGFCRAKINRHTIRGVDEKKEHRHYAVTFFGLCLAAILLFASIGVASATNYISLDNYSFTIESAPDTPVSDPNGPYTGTEGVPITVNGSGSYDPDGNIVAYEWEFGDGNNATGVTPTHTYAQDGSYNVTLTVTDNEGATNRGTTTATIADTEPTADFSASPTSGQEPLTVTFTDNSASYDGIEEWAWDFDSNGETDSTVRNPTHVYAEDGEYTVSLTVYESDGGSDTITKADYISVTKVNLDLVAEWDLDEDRGQTTVDSSGNGNHGTLVNNPTRVKGKVGKALSFDGTNDYVDCGQESSLKITGAITVEAWVKGTGDGNPYIVTKTGGPSRRSFDLSGNADGTVEFRVSGSDCNTIKSSGTAPIPTGEWVYLVGTYEPSSYVRLFVNGALATESTSSIPASQGDNGLHWYIGAREGNQGWFDGSIDEVKIYNGALSAEEIMVNYEAYPTNNPPTAIIDSITPDPAEQGKDTVSFSGHGTDTDGSVVAYNWRSSIDGQLSTASSFGKPASELSVGTHTIYFKVQDDNGAWSTEVTEDLTINPEPENSPPVADPAGPYTGTEGIAMAYDGSGAYDPDGSIVAYDWDFGDGDTATGETPTHTYAQNGTYTVTLKVTDNDGPINTSTTTATIADTGPNADFSATPTRGQEPLTLAFTDNSASYDGIVTWEWDFDNDGVTDSIVQNPTHVFADDGIYTVSLTVNESDEDRDTMTKVDYISVTKVNNPPFKPDNPSPSDGAADVSEDADLCWTGGDPDAEDTVTHDVYFGTCTSPQLVSENQLGTTYDPGALDHSTEYYWQIVATDDQGATTEGDVWAFTTIVAPDTPPIVSNPLATPDTILNDNGRPRITGTNISQLSVTVTDDTEIDTVIIDLSPIGGSDEAQMDKIPGTDTWTITTNAVEGINLDHDLIVTATDTNGNSDSSVSIQLTVLRRGDVDHDNDVDRDDAMEILKYTVVNAPDPGLFIGDVYPATGDNVVDVMDASYILKYLEGNADAP